MIFSGADLNIQDNDGNTALMLSSSNNKIVSSNEIFEMLLRGSNLNTQNKKGETALMLACENNTNGSSEEVLAALINAGAKLDTQDINGCTALMYASSKYSCSKEKCCNVNWSWGER